MVRRNDGVVLRFSLLHVVTTQIRLYYFVVVWCVPVLLRSSFTILAVVSHLLGISFDRGSFVSPFVRFFVHT